MSFVTKRDSWENHVKILAYMKLLLRPAVWSSRSYSDECQVFPGCLAGRAEEMDRMSALLLCFLLSNSWVQIAVSLQTTEAHQGTQGKWGLRNGGYKTGLGIQGYKGGVWNWGWGERTGRKKESLLIMCYLLIPSLKPPSYTLTPTTNASVPNLSKWHGFF